MQERAYQINGGVDKMAVGKPKGAAKAVQSAVKDIGGAVKAIENDKKAVKKTVRKVQTDADVKRKAVKLVVTHLRKKLPETEFIGKEHITEWIEGIEQLLEKPEFNVIEYHQVRRELNDIIERTVDEEIRFKLRDSWYSLGKALDKKVKQK